VPDRETGATACANRRAGRPDTPIRALSAVVGFRYPGSMTRHVTNSLRVLAVVVLLAAATSADAGARRSRPVRTGQTTCWNDDGQVVACAGTG
jgi:hypothetical protein